jgi:hypothetical protein
MKPAVVHGTVFAAARRTKQELLHRGVGPVVRNVQHNRVARSALRAVREGIAKSAVLRIKYFSQTLRAGRDVRKNRGEFWDFPLSASSTLGRISKPKPPLGATRNVSSDAITAAAGVAARSWRRNSLSCSASPSISISKPASVFLTHPVSRILSARR